MNRLCWLIGLLSIAFSAGCNYDIVTTPRLKTVLLCCEVGKKKENEKRPKQN